VIHALRRLLPDPINKPGMNPPQPPSGHPAAALLTVKGIWKSYSAVVLSDVEFRRFAR